jgi:hypothetical protein
MIPAVPALGNKIDYTSFDTLRQRTDSVNLASLDTLEPRLIVIHIVRRARKCRADRAML